MGTCLRSCFTAHEIGDVAITLGIHDVTPPSLAPFSRATILLLGALVLAGCACNTNTAGQAQNTPSIYQASDGRIPWQQ